MGTWIHRDAPNAGCLQGFHSDERRNQQLAAVVSVAFRALNGALVRRAGLELLVPDGYQVAWLSVFGIVGHIA